MAFSRIIRTVAAALVLIAAATTVSSAQTSLSSDEEDRAKALSGQLRCVVCQNQSILDSDADVAKDLRAIVREQIASGKSDSDIKSFLVDRYGEFVLLKPVLSAHTLLLWVAPFLFVFAGLFMFWKMTGRNKKQAEVVLTPDEERRVENLLKDGKVSD